jgi:RimJ/RimL family protein N-acetyltransferase
MQPTLETERLLLRPLSRADAARVRELAGDAHIAATTLNVPHPYEEGMAEAWIDTHQALYEAGEAAQFALILKDTLELIGCMGLTIRAGMRHAEVGYWVGVPFQGRGYCSEALQRMISFAFGPLKLHRVYAHHFLTNPASGRVMQKAGMRYEGRCREHVLKSGVFVDLELYGILETDLA